MDLDIRPVGPDQHEAFERVKELAFGQSFDPVHFERAEALREPDRMVAGFDGDELVASGLAYSFTMSVPGPGLELATGGIGGIAVLPTHRRRGLLKALMRHLLDDAHDRGEPLSVLWASQAPIYPRFGYGAATTGMRWEIAQPATVFVPGLSASGRRVRLLGGDQAKVIDAVEPVHEAQRRVRPGMIGRSPAWWRRRTEGAGADLLFVIVEGDAGIEGYASYRVSGNWGRLGPDNHIEVVEAIATTPEADIALWRYLFDVDLVTSISAWGRPPDEPLQWMLADPRQLQRSLGDGAWVRLVDLPLALSGRRYACPVRLVLDVDDPFCSWNTGRWLLEGGTDGADCTATTAAPDIACGVAELGAAMLGGTSLESLRRAGRLVELTAGAARAADDGLLWQPLPWAVTWF